jgi:acyl-coenzyme A synthetase/AMP-(fatty) acid ligase
VPLSNILSDQRAADHVVAASRSRRVTIGQLRAEVTENARRVAERGARRGLLVCDDCDRFVVGLYALLYAGAEVVLPPNANPGTLRALAGSFDLLVSDREIEDTDMLRLAASGAEAAFAPLDPDRCRLEFHTSGSSGEPKRIPKTLALLDREIAVLEELWGSTIGDASVFGTAPHQHIFGLTFSVLWPLAAGRCFSAHTYLMWEELLPELTPRAVIVSSPAHLSRLAGLPPLPRDLHPSMILTAGAPLPLSAACEAIEVFGVEPTEIFGSTETGAVAVRATAGEPARWRPLPGIETFRSDEGLLRLRSPYVPGDGVFQLADRIELFADGSFEFKGRADRVVKVEGKRVSLPEMEQQIAALPWIESAAVVPLTAARTCLGAVATLSEDGAAELARLGKFRLERLFRRELASVYGASAWPQHWRFVAYIPVDPMGKRRASDLAMLFEKAQ